VPDYRNSGDLPLVQLILIDDPILHNKFEVILRIKHNSQIGQRVTVHYQQIGAGTGGNRA
jgi:hypothetical protein